MFHYLIGHSTANMIIRETCRAIWDKLSPIYVKKPNTREEWLVIAKDFYNKWNLPNCIGAIDGKHVTIIAPQKSGSLHYNYKNTFSNVLLAISDANYQFIAVDIGAYGSQSDGGIFKTSVLGRQFENNELNVPLNGRLPNHNCLIPYFLAGDAAFPIKKFMMRPFPGKQLNQKQRIFNYRLSRGRRVIENAFGILCTRWRIMWAKINAFPETVDIIVSAAVALHNFAMQTQVNEENDFVYAPNGYTDWYNDNGELVLGAWREEIPDEWRDLEPDNSRGLSSYAIQVRNILADYFLSPAGELPWQYDYADFTY